MPVKTAVGFFFISLKAAIRDFLTEIPLNPLNFGC